MGLQATSHILQNLTALYRQYLLECNCIVMRGGVYDEILPEPEGNPEGGARGISRGLRRYFIVYPDLSHNTVILNYLRM